jgi:hypothetical protein
MDDVDAVQCQIARNMLQSGDWVTARIDGVVYLEKSPLLYWLIASCYKIFGAYDWAARLPVALSSIGLAWITMLFGAWAFGRRAGLYAGTVIGTCVGLFLFTRIQIPDVTLTLTIALAMWSFLRALDEREERPRLWACCLAASLGLGLLLKSLIALVFPLGAAFFYLVFTRQLLSRRTWVRLRPLSGAGIVLAIAAPWHIWAMLRNPPYFDLTMASIPGQWHGFFWFYFINEQLLRFLNLRYPRDYDTVPRSLFWLLHIAWLSPWSVYLPGVFRQSFRPVDRAGRTRLLALCWIGVVLVFFSFSTTQEYYSMPCYPALALLIGCAMSSGGQVVRWGTRVVSVIAGLAAITVFALASLVWHRPTPGDISVALSSHPEAYKLSLGHMEDLTLASLAYLRWPLVLAGLAFIIGAAGTIVWRGRKAMLAIALMMVVFYQAARLALVSFDPYLSSRPIANALLHSPHGGLVIDHHYYTFSSVFFYTNRTALLLNGKFNNLVYGAAAPAAPSVFIDDAEFARLWAGRDRWYLAAEENTWLRFNTLLGAKKVFPVLRSGGKYLLTNHPLD